MATIQPFCGLRPAAKLAQQVASPPYDVLDSAEARQITAGNRNSFLRVTKAEVDLPEGIDTHSPQVYAQARTTLDKFIEDQILIQDDKPCFYIYRLTMNGHIQIGLVAAASVDEYQQNIIKKHELTRPDKEQDRVDHIMATEAQTGSVFLTYKADSHIDSLIERCMNGRPACDFVTADGIGHALYVVDNDAHIEALKTAFANIDYLYIADGHHRSAAAGRVADHCRQAQPGFTGQEPYNWFLTVIFPHNMMYIMDYNRVIKDLNGLTTADFLTNVAQKFDIAVSTDGAVKPQQAHCFGMYIDNTWYLLTAKAGSFSDSDPVGVLDVSILQENLLQPILAIGNPRTDQRIHFVGGIRGMAELERLVDCGQYALAFSLYPTSIDQLIDIADAGEIMPPKSTWFEPKLRDAMVVHATPLPKA